MLQEMAMLASLRIDDHPPELNKKKVKQWLRRFVPKLKRTSSRSNKCRLISAVERTQFRVDKNAFYWQFCKFDGTMGAIFNQWKEKKEDFEMTQIQKQIILAEPALKNKKISRWEIEEELGEWDLPHEIETKQISGGGEALVFAEQFGSLETAVRVQVFDPFLFTDRAGSCSWRTNLSKGKNLIMA